MNGVFANPLTARKLILEAQIVGRDVKKRAARKDIALSDSHKIQPIHCKRKQRRLKIAYRRNHPLAVRRKLRFLRLICACAPATHRDHCESQDDGSNLTTIQVTLIYILHE